jgi:hypothetical protein
MNFSDYFAAAGCQHESLFAMPPAGCLRPARLNKIAQGRHSNTYVSRYGVRQELFRNKYFRYVSRIRA